MDGWRRQWDALPACWWVLDCVPSMFTNVWIFIHSWNTKWGFHEEEEEEAVKQEKSPFLTHAFIIIQGPFIGGWVLELVRINGKRFRPIPTRWENQLLPLYKNYTVLSLSLSLCMGMYFEFRVGLWNPAHVSTPHHRLLLLACSCERRRKNP